MAAFDSEAFRARWSGLSLAEQLGNIGSEVDRAISWRRRGEPARSLSALERALELFDLTISDRRWRGGRRLTELTRARESLCEAYFVTHDSSSLDSLSRYFYHFAYAARRSRDMERDGSGNRPSGCPLEKG